MSFTSTYLQLILLSNDASPDKFLTTDGYGQLESLGPSLPVIKSTLPRSQSSGGGSVTVNFKSIKPPYKFTAVLNNVPLSHSVYRIKQDLIEAVESLAGFEPANFKFMIKGKVLLDTTALSAITTEDVSVMVLVSPPTKKDPVPEPEVVPVQEKVVVLAATWAKIGEILQADLGEAGNAVLAKLQSVPLY